MKPTGKQIWWYFEDAVLLFVIVGISCHITNTQGLVAFLVLFIPALILTTAVVLLLRDYMKKIGD